MSDNLRKQEQLSDSEKQSEPVLEKQKFQIENAEEAEYKKAEEAVNILYEMSLTGNYDEEKVKKINGLIWPLNRFRDRLIDGEGHNCEIKETFFKTLPTVNKLAKIYSNFLKNDCFGMNPEIRFSSALAQDYLCVAIANTNQEVLSKLDEERVKDLFGSAELLLKDGSQNAIEESLRFLKDSKQLFEQLIRNKNLPIIGDRAEELDNFTKTHEFELLVAYRVSANIQTRKPDEERLADLPYCKEILYGALKRYGFDPDEIIDQWVSATGHQGGADISANLEKISRLENERPGIAKMLYEKFGIRNFRRYPEEILITQYDQFEDTERPYGIMVQALADHNGIFGVDNETWQKFFDEIKDKYNFRVFEASGKRELVQHLINQINGMVTVKRYLLLL